MCANFRSIACKFRSKLAFLSGKNSSALLLRVAILKFATAPQSELNFLCFCILDQPGLNLNAINLKFSWVVGLTIFISISYKLRSGRAFLLGKNSSAFLLRYAILKFATGSSEWDDITEIVLFCHVGCGNSFICAIWTHKTKRKTGNMVDKYFSVLSYNSEGLLRISILRKNPFSCDFNIVWIKPYHSTRVRLPVFC